MTEKDEYIIKITGAEKSMLNEWYLSVADEYLRIANFKTSNKKISEAIELRNKIQNSEPNMEFY